MLNTGQLTRDVGKKTVTYTVHVHTHTLENYRLNICSYMSTLLLNCQLFPQTTKVLELKEKPECSYNITKDTCFSSTSFLQICSAEMCQKFVPRQMGNIIWQKSQQFNPAYDRLYQATKALQVPQEVSPNYTFLYRAKFLNALFGKKSGGTCTLIVVLTVLSLPTALHRSNLHRY